jgi:hypothetical protein
VWQILKPPSQKASTQGIHGHSPAKLRQPCKSLHKHVTHCLAAHMLLQHLQCTTLPAASLCCYQLLAAHMLLQHLQCTTPPAASLCCYQLLLSAVTSLHGLDGNCVQLLVDPGRTWISVGLLKPAARSASISVGMSPISSKLTGRLAGAAYGLPICRPAAHATPSRGAGCRCCCGSSLSSVGLHAMRASLTMTFGATCRLPPCHTAWRHLCASMRGGSCWCAAVVTPKAAVAVLEAQASYRYGAACNSCK